MIEKINTNHPHVFRFDNVFDENECSFIKRFVLNKFPLYEKVNEDVVPFNEDQNLPYFKINELPIKKFINCYRFITTQFIMESFKKNTYPTFTDIVLWQPGRSMDYHVDDGNGNPELDFLFTRTFTSVLYINDDYEGGETVIKGYNGYPDYISKPKTGSIIILRSDKKSEHKVNKILSGNRVTSCCWFTLEKQNIEI